MSIVKQTRSAALTSLIVVTGLLASPPALSAVGRTDSVYGVSPSGAPQYSVPIRATDGVAGLTPSLAITYVGPGQRTILGVGFEISGLSYITPCRKTIAQDIDAAPILLQAGDRFCLDGLKLRKTGTGTYGDTNTTYQTELDRMARATSKGSTGLIPGWFTVEMRDGLIYEYGNSPDSKLLAGTGAGAPPQFWAVSKITDRAGNYVTFTYDTDNAARRFRPDRIDYTAGNGGAARYQIKFVYQGADQPGPSQDITPSAAGGATHLETRLLDRIELKLDGNTYRQYRFTYQTAAGTNQRLTHVQECAATAGDCFPATMFTWQSATAGHGAAIPASAVAVGVRPLDLNGDGFEDLVWPSSGTWWYMLGNASGYSAASNTGIAATNPSKALPIEWNGDGFMDLLVDWSDGMWRILKGTATGFASPVQAGTGGIPSNTGSSAWWIADLNGDGRDDLVRASLVAPATVFARHTGSSGFGVEMQIFSDNNLRFLGNPFSMIAAQNQSSVRHPDFNGDGRTDLLLRMCIWDQELGQCLTTRWWYLVSNGTSLTNYGNTPGTTLAVSPVTGDFNNDGLTDIAFPAQSPASWCVAMSQGGGGLIRICGPSTSGYDLWGGMTGDYDGDGYADLYVYKTATLAWEVYRGTGTGISLTPISTGISLSSTGSWLITDFNGDGLRDLARFDTGTLTWRGLPHAGLPGERLLSATDAFGNAVSFTYVPMTNSAVYTKGTGAIYPNREYQSTTPLVRTMQISPGGGSAFTMTYSYTNGRFDNWRHSFLGMGTRKIIDGRNGVYATETYRQDFPYIGALASVTVKQPAPGNQTILSTSNTYDRHLLDATAGNQRFLPYLKQSVTSQYEVGGVKNGNEITKVTETRTVNTFGNTTALTIDTEDKDAASPTVGELYRTEITTAYLEDTAAWCLYLPTSRSEKRTLPSAANETRATSWTVLSASACRITKEVIEPGGATNISLTTDIDYDNCGNVDSVSSYPSSDPTKARTTTINYGAFCQRPETVTNPLGQVFSTTYDWRFARPNGQTDPNDLSTTTEYDTFGRVTRVLRPDGTATRFAPTACTSGNGWCGKDSSVRLKLTQTERSSTDGLLRTDEQFYDGAGRVRFSQSDSFESGAAIVSTVYDGFGRPASRSQPYFQGSSIYLSTFTYDLIGRLIEQDSPINEGSPTGRVTAIAYEGRDIRITDPLNHMTTRSSNAIGQLRSVADPSPGGTTTYAYRPFGGVAKITDAAGNISEWTYNLRGFVDQTIDPDSGTWTYLYNAFGELTNVRDAKTTAPAWTTTYTYDKLSRPDTRVESEGTTDWTWGNSATAKNIGQLQTITSPGNYQEQYFYDNFGRPLQQRITADGQTYQFDETYDTSTGLLASLEYPTSTSSYRLKLGYEYTKNVLARVRQFGGNPIYWEVTSTDAYGHIQGETFGNGVLTATDFDQASGFMDGRIGGLGGGNALVDATTEWDLNGNLKKRIDEQQVPNVTEEFVYDALDRLDLSRRNGTENLNVTLDAIGNITNKTGVGTYDYTAQQAGCTYYTHNQPRAVRKAGTTVYCYDKNGNMTKRAGSTINYTSYNLPSVINSGSNSSTISYGAFRNRYKQVAVTSGNTETTIYVGGLLEKVTKGSLTEFRHLIHGANGLAAIYTRRNSGTPLNEAFYVHGDHLGSPELIAKESGAVHVRLSFAAYGERRDKDWDGPVSAGDLTTIGNTTRHGFTDHEHLDSVGLIHMNGRVYEPLAGRFLSADPFIQAPGFTQSVNPYSYTFNSPLSYIDPSGYSADDPLDTYKCYDCYTFSYRGTFAWHDWSSVIQGHPIWNPTIAAPPGARSTAVPYEGGTLPQYSTVERVRGDQLLSPYLSSYDERDPNFHRYSIGPTDLCKVGEAGCTFSDLSPIVARNSVPFVTRYSGAGSYGLPYGLGLDPIDHSNPKPGVWINDTLDGHRYHPGSVAHALYESGGHFYLYTVGAGVGPDPQGNIRNGQWIFGGMHMTVRGEVLNMQLGLDNPWFGP